MNQERRIRNQICTKRVIGTSEFKLGSENFLRKNDTTIATTMTRRRRTSITMCTFDTNDSTRTMDSAHPSQNDESFADSDALSFMRMQQRRRSSLSDINIALSILTVGDDDELQEENIEKKLTIALDNETPSNTLRRGAVILDENVLKDFAIAMGDCDETPAKPFRRLTNDGIQALDENVLKELAILALGDCDEAPAKPFRRPTNNGIEVLDESILKELTIALGDETPAKPFRRATNGGIDALHEKVLKELAILALDNETPSKHYRRGVEITDINVLKEVAITLGDDTPTKSFRRTINDDIEALDGKVPKELSIAVDNETPSKPFRRGAEILDENVQKELAITLGDETPAKPFRRVTNGGIDALHEKVLKELAILALDNETPSKPFRRGAEILDENVQKELAITLGDETPPKPFRRTINDDIEALDEKVPEELAIAVDNEAPSKPFRRGAEILDEKILEELAITLGDETPAKPFRRTTNDGIQAIDEKVLKELAIAVDNETPSKPFRRGAERLDENILEAPEKPFRRISTPDGIEVLDESIQKELALTLCQFGSSFGFAAKIASIPILATNTLPGGAIGAGALLSAAGLSAFVGAPFGGYIADRFGAKGAAIISGIICSLGLILIPVALQIADDSSSSYLGIEVAIGGVLLQTKALFFSLAVLLWSLGVGAQGPALNALAQEKSLPGVEATSLSLVKAAGDGTYIIAPLILGVVADAVNEYPGVECALAGSTTLLGTVALAILVQQGDGLK